MKRTFLFLAMMAGMLSSASGADECFDDTGWQQGPSDAWFVNWDKAIAESKKTNKPIFALSTGSDWCGWCIKLKKEVLTTETFKAFAKKNLVLIYLDSPRKPLPEAQSYHNNKVRQELGLEGRVPCAAVFATDARRLGVLSGGGYTVSNYVERLEKMLTEKGELPKSGEPSKIFTKGYAESETRQDEKEEKMLDEKSQEELKKLAAQIRREKLDAAEKALKAAEEEAAAENKRGKPGVEKKVTNGNSAAQEVKTNAIKWTYEIVDGGVVLGGRRGTAVPKNTAGNLVVPKSIGGLPVREVGNLAFYQCNELTAVELPPSIRNIGRSAFERCGGLTSLTIPEGVTNIDSSAFWCCSNLKSVTIPASVTRIGSRAFFGTKLECTDTNGFVIVDNCLIECKGRRMGEIVIPGNIRVIAEDAFRDCHKNVSFSVDASNPTYCSRNGLICTKDGMTLVAGVNGDVEIPFGVTRIGRNAFANCSELTSVSIPASVKIIEDFAFWGCSGLMSVSIPSGVTHIGERSFERCTGLRSFSVDSSNPAYSSRNGLLCSKDGATLLVGVNQELTIPPCVKCIESGAFKGCSGLTSVKIPTSVSRIGDAAFSYCDGLTSVTIPEGVTNVGSGAFRYCKNLRNVSLPSSLRRIEPRTFEECHGLESVVLAQGVENIDEYAFEDCRSLASLMFPPSVSYIGWYAFVGCTNLVSVDIQGCNVGIGDGAFSRNTPVGMKLRGISAVYGPRRFSVDSRFVAEDAKMQKAVVIGSTNELMRCDDGQPVTVAIPVDNVCVKDAFAIARSLLGTNANICVLKNINALLVTGEAKNIRSVCEAVRIYDKTANKSVERSWRLKYAKAEDAKRILDRFAAGFKPVLFRQVPPRNDRPVNCLTIARTEDVARGILTVKADEEENWLSVRMVGSASAAEWDCVDNLVKAIDSPSRDEDLAERKFVLKRQEPDRVVSAVNALLGEGVAVLAAGETNAIVAHVGRDSLGLFEDVVLSADSCLADWIVTIDVKRVPDVRTLQEARRMASEKGVDTVCRMTSSVMNGRTGALTVRLDKDDPDTEFKMTVEPRWAGDKDLALRWDVCGCEREGKGFQMSGAAVLCLDQAKVIGGMMRAESRGFFGLGASEEIDTAYLLQITVSDKYNAY